MKEYKIVYSIESDCRKCPPNEFEFLVFDYGDRFLSYEGGKPNIYKTWDEVVQNVPVIYKLKEV